jgi:hypothetical protein
MWCLYIIFWVSHSTHFYVIFRLIIFQTLLSLQIAMVRNCITGEFSCVLCKLITGLGTHKTQLSETTTFLRGKLSFYDFIATEWCNTDGVCFDDWLERIRKIEGWRKGTLIDGNEVWRVFRVRGDVTKHDLGAVRKRLLAAFIWRGLNLSAPQDILLRSSSFLPYKLFTFWHPLPRKLKQKYLILYSWSVFLANRVET